MDFDARVVKDEVVSWIREWFDKNGKGCNAVVGISGGKDSSVVAALCVEALGKERVIGILMPNNVQDDIDVSKSLVEYLGIRHYIVNINVANDYIFDQVNQNLNDVTAQTKNNLPPRLRMTVLYAFSQSLNGRVANTSNLSEDWVGYATRYGDSAGDFGPIAKLTVGEVKSIGRELGLPGRFVDKVPIDGLCGKTDEENLGFSYATLDKYIREGICEDLEVKARIDRLHECNKFKLELLPMYELKR